MSSSEWKEVAISDTILSSNTGLDAIKRAPIVDYDSGIKCLRIQDISQDKSFENWGFCTIEDKNYSKFQLKKGDIIVARTGATIGVNKLIKKDMKSVYNNGLIRIKVNSDIIDYRYLYFNMQGDKYKGHIESISGGTSTQPNMKMNALLDLKIMLPSLQEQKAIADTLSCLDNKIELNNNINKTLEEMAQAIFKNWFVDFEPFQDGEFEDSELGKIPKGWRIGTLSDLGEVIGGSTPSKAKSEYYTEKGIAWITPKDLSNNKDKFISKGNIDITELGLKNSSTKIMPKGTVLFSSRAPIGYVAIAKNNVTTNQGFKSVVPKINIGTAYVYCFFKNNIEMIESRATGSTFKEVSGSIMKQIPALIPNDSILLKFQDICNLYFEQQMFLENQNQALTTMRDALLPKLISGEIRVPTEEV